MSDHKPKNHQLRHKVYIKDSATMESFLDAESVDLVLTGPPYWDEVVYSDDPGQLSAITSYETFLASIARVWAGCAKVLKPGGVLALWTHDFYREQKYIPFHADLIRTIPSELTLKAQYVWDRYLHRDKGPMPSSRPLGTQLQYVLVFQKSGQHPANHQQIEQSLARLFWQPVWSHKTQPKLLGSKILFRLAFELSKYVPRSLSHLRTKIMSRSHHLFSDPYIFQDYITQCPPEIAESLIKAFSNPKDTVLDPFLGSGTTMQVADQLDRHCLGIEINPKALPTIKANLGPIFEIKS